jgi:phosphatidylinositol-3-phosphatase
VAARQIGRLIPAAAAFAAALAFAGSAVPYGPAATAPCGFRSTPPSNYAHVIWIWMENHAYSQIIGSSAAPYENQLANACGLATNYFAIRHPSLPNYIAATSGATQAITDDGPPSQHPLSVVSLFEQAIRWRGYEESMPSNCRLTDSGLYAVRHNPAAYYTRIRTACSTKDVPMGSMTAGAFLNDLNNNTLRKFSFVTPNLCNDTHDCSIMTGDNWLKGWVPKILASAAYQSGATVLFITWDEDNGGSGNHVATIVVSPTTAPGTQSGTRFNHYSLLRTTEELLGLSPFLGNAATAASMRAPFNL